MVVPTVTDLGGGSYKLVLSPEIIDPDAYDLTKNAYFGGHGHDGTVKALVIALWGGPNTYTFHSGLLDNSDYTKTTWDTPMEYIYTGKWSGASLWYSVIVRDSHRQDTTANANYPTGKSTSGWRYITAP